MSVEPKQSMEDQLRAYAESRRLEAAPGFELDPPVRRRLQDEVRRVYHATVSPTAPRFLGGFGCDWRWWARPRQWCCS
jgi:hypothetical protein